MYYNVIFVSNVHRILREQGMTKQELSDASGISISFLSDLTTGKGNPSLKVMEAIATALHTPLPTLLEASDLSEEELASLAGEGGSPSSLPKGYRRVSVVLPLYKAFLVEKWHSEALEAIRGK